MTKTKIIAMMMVVMIDFFLTTNTYIKTKVQWTKPVTTGKILDGKLINLHN